MKIKHRIRIILGLGVLLCASGYATAADRESKEPAADGDSKRAAAQQEAVAQEEAATPEDSVVQQEAVDLEEVVVRDQALLWVLAHATPVQVPATPAPAPQPEAAPTPPPATPAPAKATQKERSVAQIVTGWSQLAPLSMYYYLRVGPHKNHPLAPAALQALRVASMLSLMYTESQPQGDVSKSLAMAALAYRMVGLAAQRAEKGDVIGWKEVKPWLPLTLAQLAAAGIVGPKVAAQQHKFRNFLNSVIRAWNALSPEKKALIIGGVAGGTFAAKKQLSGYRKPLL